MIVLNRRWTSLGKYMIPEAKYLDDIKDGFGGYCSYGVFGCKIVIKNKYINDIGILRHEQAHARQYGRLLWIHSFLSSVSSTYRLIIELEAYRSQVSEYEYLEKSQYKWIVDALYVKYDLHMSLDTISELCDYAFSDLIELRKIND